MTTEELAIVLTARFDQVQEALSTVEGLVNKYADNAEKAGERTENAFNASALAIVAAGVALTEYLKSAVETAGKAESLNIILDNMAAKAGNSAEQVEQTVKGMEDLGLASEDAKSSLIRLIQAHVSLQDAIKLTAIAQDFATSRGMDATQAMNMLTRAIQTGRPMMLQMMGMIGNVQQAQAQYANSIGLTAQELTPLQQKQAIVQALLRTSAAAAGSYALVQHTLGVETKLLGNEMEEASILIGSVFLSTIKGAVEVVRSAVQWFNNQNDIVKTSVAVVLGAVTAYVALVGVMRSVMIVIPQIIAAFSSVNAALLASPWALWAMAAAVAIAGTMILLDKMDKHVDATNAKITGQGSAIQRGMGITFNQVESTEDPTKQLDLAKRLYEFNVASLALDKNMNDEMRSKLEYQNQLLAPKIKELELSVGIKNAHQADVDMYKKMLAAAREQIDFVLTGMDLEIAKIDKKKAAAISAVNKDVADERVKAEMIKEINQTTDLEIMMAKAHFKDMDTEHQLIYLQGLKANEKLYAQDSIAIDRQLMAMKDELRGRDIKEEQAAITSFEASWASQASQMVTVFGQATMTMGQLFENMVNQIVQKFIESGIISIMTGGAGAGSGMFNSFSGNGGSAGLFGGGGFLGLGFDDSTNDSSARTAGQSKWYKDFTNNFSKGYVNQALLSSQVMAPAAAAPAMGGGGGGVNVSLVYSPAMSMATPLDARNMAKFMGDELIKIGTFKRNQ